MSEKVRFSVLFSSKVVLGSPRPVVTTGPSYIIANDATAQGKERDSVHNRSFCRPCRMLRIRSAACWLVYMWHWQYTAMCSLLNISTYCTSHANHASQSPESWQSQSSESWQSVTWPSRDSHSHPLKWWRQFYYSCIQHSFKTRSLAIAKRPCDCCIILKSGSYTKAI